MSNPHLFGTGYGLARTINIAIKKHSLTPRTLFRLGPRFLILKVYKEKTPYMFKVCLERYQKATGLKTTPQSFLKEIQFFKHIKKSKQLHPSIPRLKATSVDGFIWMLREYVDGHFQNIGMSNFLFRSSFFTRANSDLLISFFDRLSKQTKNLTPSLKKQMKTYPLKCYEDSINWKEKMQTMGLKKYTKKMQSLLDTNRKAFNTAPQVLTHHEPYASHIIKKEDGNLALIDWENIGLNNPIHDISVIWFRAYKHKKWQNDILKKASRTLLIKSTFNSILKVEVALQALGNLTFFTCPTLTPEEKKAKKEVIRFLKTTLIKQL